MLRGDADALRTGDSTGLGAAMATVVVVTSWLGVVSGVGVVRPGNKSRKRFGRNFSIRS